MKTKIIPGYMCILMCSDDSYYTGSTKNLEVRMQEHQTGNGAKYTKSRLPVKLVYHEFYSLVEHAFYREKQVQGWSRRKKMALIDGRIDDLKHSSNCQNSTHFTTFDKK